MVVIYCIIGVLVLFLIYMVIPNYYIRNHSKNCIRVLQDNPQNKTIALTFDDGPDPRYTPQLLDILKQHDVSATFFLVAKKAQEHPEIISRMQEEGHCLAMHTYKHKSAWLSHPYETVNEFDKSLKIFKTLGLHIKYFRPPWGTFNAFTYYGAKKHGLKVILWSVEAYDWRKNNSKENIHQILMNRTGSNDIIVLHDSGGAKGAPLNTINALKTTIPKLIQDGYTFVTIDTYDEEKCGEMRQETV